MLTLSMSPTFTTTGLLILGLVLTAQNAHSATPDSVQLKGPISTQDESSLLVPAQVPAQVPANPADAGAGNGLAPGEDGTMTQDMIMVGPDNPKQPVGRPLSALVGTALKIQIDKTDIVFDKLRGVMVTVTNDTGRPIVVEGDVAKATVGGKSYTCVHVAAIQQAIVPRHKLSQDFEDLLTHAVPAAVTVGASPTIRDFRISQKPILDRYGPDELRRKIEYSRFGRRILWTQQKTQGIVYFQTDDQLTGAQMEIPVTTLFDDTDKATLTSAK